MILKRRRPKKFGTERPGPIRCEPHLQWVRGHECAICGRRAEVITPNGITTRYHRCEGKIIAAHVRTGTDGAAGEKPSDWWAIPLCESLTGGAHKEQHQIGEAAFERRYNIDMKAIARDLWNRSPAGKRYRRERELAALEKA